MDIMKSIREERRKKEITQRAFAKKIGVSLGSYRNWETKKYIPNIFFIEKMLNELGKNIKIQIQEIKK